MSSATPATDVPSAAARRSAWRAARLVDARPETATARTLVLEVRDWRGHLPGQHVDVRLTAEDGYTAERSYSLAAPPAADRIELTVQRVADGEVSPFLVDDFAIGDVVEVRGPLGGWFVRRPADRGALLLVAGGAGIVPLMAMIRARDAVAQAPPCRLLYSIRTPADVLYAQELRARDRADIDLTITLVHTRTAPPEAVRPPGRISATDLADADRAAAVYVCGPTGFVEHAANLLIALGFPAATVRTERFGPSGGGT
jgi:ferredoxin-NADP reductase